jgi:hypothetical protein
MRATTFLKQKMFVAGCYIPAQPYCDTHIYLHSTAIDMDPSGTRALVSLLNGHAHIISVPAKGKLGQEEQVFHMEKTPSGLSMRFPMPAVFTGNNGDGVMLGSADGCLLIWNPQTMALLAGLPTDDGASCQCSHWLELELKHLFTAEAVNVAAVSALSLIDLGSAEADSNCRASLTLPTSLAVWSQLAEAGSHGGLKLDTRPSLCLIYVTWIATRYDGLCSRLNVQPYLATTLDDPLYALLPPLKPTAFHIYFHIAHI